MAQDKIQMPSSGGGLVRYFEDTSSRIQINPKYVLIVIVLVIIVGIYLYKTSISI